MSFSPALTDAISQFSALAKPIADALRQEMELRTRLEAQALATFEGLLTTIRDSVSRKEQDRDGPEQLATVQPIVQSAKKDEEEQDSVEDDPRFAQFHVMRTRNASIKRPRAAHEKEEDAIKSLCGASTRAGKPCERPSSYPDRYCGRHRNMREAGISLGKK